MTQTAINYAKVLYDLDLSEGDIKETEALFRKNPVLEKSLSNPLVPEDAGKRIIDRLVPAPMRSFVKTVYRHHKISSLGEIFEAYQELIRKKNRTLKASLRYVTAPKEEQLEGIRTFLCRTFHAKKAEIDLTEDKSLIGGFILQAEGNEYDWSLRGRYRKLEQKLTRR